ncbi:MAG: class I SAM-dependent methyltransferase [Alphaproteobacteria bacterium]|nr:class I SAM-dependent methyltransferase [Alphaproteobacteria bacterium]
MAYPIKHELTVLTAIRTLKLYLRHPFLAARSERREWGRYRALKKMERAGLAQMYDTAHFPVGAYAPDWADLWNIYTLVKQRRPNVIVECGAGCSTLMFAAAIRDGGFPCEFWSFDESPYWIDKLKGYMPDDLKRLVRLEHRDSIVVPMHGRSAASFANLPSIRPNFVYVDGPLASGAAPVVGTGLHFAEGAPDDYFILVDGLGKTFRFYREVLGDRYRYRENYLHHYRAAEKIAS